MGNDTLRTLLNKAVELYRNGEILAALTEWEHAVALDPSCDPAQRAIRDLRANYDLIDESLRPGGQALDIDEYAYSEADAATTRRAGGVVIAAESQDVQPSEFYSEATAELPGIKALEAMSGVVIAAESQDAQPSEFYSEATAELPGIQALEAMSGVVIATESEDTRPSEFYSEATAELPGIQALEAIASARVTADALSAEDDFQNLPTGDMPGIAGLSAMKRPGGSGEGTANPSATDARADLLPGIGTRATLPAGSSAPPIASRPGPDHQTDALARDFGTAVTLEHKHGDFGDIELGRAGAAPTATRSAQEMSTRATEELGSLSLQELQLAAPAPVLHPNSNASSASPGRDVGASIADDDPFADEDAQWTESALTPAGMESQQAELASLHAIEQTIREAVERGAPDRESASDRTRRRIKGLLERAQRAYTQGDVHRAVIAVELAFDEDPDSAVSHKLLNLHREMVAAIFESYLDNFRAAPALNVALADLRYEHIDARAAFLLSRVDGTLTLEELIDVAGMPRVEALRYLSSLVLRGILILSR